MLLCSNVALDIHSYANLHTGVNNTGKLVAVVQPTPSSLSILTLSSLNPVSILLSEKEYLFYMMVLENMFIYKVYICYFFFWAEVFLEYHALVSPFKDLLNIPHATLPKCFFLVGSCTDMECSELAAYTVLRTSNVAQGQK